VVGAEELNILYYYYIYHYNHHYDSDTLYTRCNMYIISLIIRYIIVIILVYSGFRIVARIDVRRVED